jgi:hypothetical protein
MRVHPAFAGAADFRAFTRGTCVHHLNLAVIPIPSVSFRSLHVVPVPLRSPGLLHECSTPPPSMRAVRSAKLAFDRRHAHSCTDRAGCPRDAEPSPDRHASRTDGSGVTAQARDRRHRARGGSSIAADRPADPSTGCQPRSAGRAFDSCHMARTVHQHQWTGDVAGCAFRPRYSPERGAVGSPQCERRHVGSGGVRRRATAPVRVGPAHQHTSHRSRRPCPQSTPGHRGIRAVAESRELVDVERELSVALRGRPGRMAGPGRAGSAPGWHGQACAGNFGHGHHQPRRDPRRSEA